MHVLDEKKVEEIRAAYREGLTRTAAAKRCCVGRDTVARYYDMWREEDFDSVSAHEARFARLAAMIENPAVVREIDKALREMRHDWLDVLALRQSALRRQSGI